MQCIYHGLNLPLQVPSGETRNLVQQLVSQQALSLKEEYGHLEKDLNIHVYDHPERSSSVLTQDSQTKLLTLLTTLPHGVIKWSHAVPGKYDAVSFHSQNPKHVCVDQECCFSAYARQPDQEALQACPSRRTCEVSDSHACTINCD